MNARKKLSQLFIFLLLFSQGLSAEEPPQRRPKFQPYSTEQRFRRTVTRGTPAPAPNTIESATDATPSSRFPSYDPKFPPPAGLSPFQLSQDYPSVYDVNEKFPWSEIDFRANGASYLQAVLKYCLEGNREVDFRGQENAKRKWYHAPWMHDDSEDKETGKRQGREYHHGLTRERRSRAKELHPLQTTDKVQNWAVSLYSDRGGYTIGRTWLTSDGFPAPSQATFPDNTVSFKLLFTAASLDEVPYLKNSFEWTANINPVTAPSAGTPFQRVDQPLRLLQLDVAVKDPRAAMTSGWIFGTFIYDGSQPGATPWDRLVPVGLSWGDDSGEKRLLDAEGSDLNPYLKQSSLNASLVQPPEGADWGHRAYVRHFGLGARLNGPVDNPYSSCLSCHGRAGTFATALPLNENSGRPMQILAGKDATLGSKTAQVAGFEEFFRLIRPNSHLEQALDPDLGQSTYVTVDYSLQLSQGIRNFYQALRLAPTRLNGLRNAQESVAEFLDTAPTRPRLPSVSRDED